jgi:pyridoxine 5'-phosphate synthase PdxJ
MTTIEKKSLRVGKYVDTNHVNILVSNYKKTRWGQNSDLIGKEDSLSVWYSIEEMEEFLQRAKQCGADGIRMHFGAYPANFAKNPEVSEMQTIVMVANKTTETAFGKVEKNIYVNAENGKQILAYNYGGVLPTGDGIAADGVGITIVERANNGLTVI